MGPDDDGKDWDSRLMRMAEIQVEDGQTIQKKTDEFDYQITAHLADGEGKNQKKLYPDGDTDQQDPCNPVGLLERELGLGWDSGVNGRSESLWGAD